MKRTKEETYNIISDRLKEINAFLLEPFTYGNNKTKFRVKCKIDEHEWYTTYYRLINAKNRCML